jgi:hypothetical protein
VAVRSFRLSAKAAFMLVASVGALEAQAVGFDVTRTWTLCTLGDANSCAALSIRTYGLSGGGSHVAIGLSNLQGTSLFDNLAGSLLNNASFTFALSAGAQNLGTTLTGAGAGGASGSPEMNLDATGTQISINAPGTSWNNVYWKTRLNIAVALP